MMNFQYVQPDTQQAVIDALINEADAQFIAGSGDAAFGEQHVQRDEQVEIGSRHGATLARFQHHDMAFCALFNCKCCTFRHIVHALIFPASFT